MLGKDGRIYDRSFDSDHDGSLNAYERSMMDSIVFGEDSDEKSYMEDESDDIEYSLALEGVDLDDLEDMSEEERNEVLEDARLDSDGFDF